MVTVLVCEHAHVLWTGSQLNRCPGGWVVPPAWSCQAAESLAVLRGSSMLCLYVQMQPGIPGCKMEHPWSVRWWFCFIHSWSVTEFDVSTWWDGLCHWNACLCSLLFQQNTSWAFRAQCSLQQGTGREWNNYLQTDTAYEGPPRLSSLFLAHNPFLQILVILLKNLVGESVFLTHMSRAAVIVQAAVPRGIFPIFVA